MIVKIVFRESLRRLEGSGIIDSLGNHRKAGGLHRRCQQSRSFYLSSTLNASFVGLLSRLFFPWTYIIVRNMFTFRNHYLLVYQTIQRSPSTPVDFCIFLNRMRKLTATFCKS
jgi:hypothetical protein